MDILVILGAIFLLLLLQGFFSGSEIALVNSDRTRLQRNAREGHHGSILALKLLERPEVVLTTTLVGTNISLVLLTVLFTTLMVTWLGDTGELLAVLLLTPLTLVIGEVVPKSVFQQQSDQLTPRIVYALYLLSLALFPIVFLFSRVARLAARVMGGGKPGAGMFAVREQLRAVLETAEGGSPDSPFDQIRIRNVVRFGELSAGDMMLPASEMTAIDTNTSVNDAVELIRNTAYSHVPVFEGRRTNVVGMISLTVWNLVEMDLSQGELAGSVKPALFVPAIQPVAELLPVLQAREDQSAIVVDEFGSCVGMISTEMILESIIGPVQTGTSAEEHMAFVKPGYEILGEDLYLMDARLPVKDVNQILATNISTAIAHSVGGLVIARLRHVPVKGESLDESGFTFSVEEASDRAIIRLRVERKR